ncbi:MAG: phospho-N-acetylmuramoyl-pentapeptide-transferase [Chloroherpetonaceae bacterium]|nr:phospho-N-acetylmuramoyl-pentapeptide-transferase [Chloroherpetonaceae bacterium]MDW8437642.1 phospho-N-acetylmuramoyl-pentapeptide-transferase [Chloroherpetonaceae bacterium]
MLYYLLKHVGETYQVSWLRLVDYISFRSLAAAVTALLIAMLFGERIIEYLKTKVIEPIKEEAPEEHRKKVGIPTMGGFIILLSVLGASLLWSKLASPFAWLILLAVAWMGAIGFIDDYLKVVKKVKGGLSERYKLFGQLALGLAIGIYTVLDPKLSALLSNTTVPFFKNLVVDYGYWYVPVCVFIVAAVSNAVNLTDGLDGLAAGCSAISLLTLAGFAYLTGNAKFAKYLNIVYIEGAGEVTILAMAMAAACVGFLWFNAHPAQVFMGDTGSLAIGGAMAVIALLIKKELQLPVIAGIFLIETLSVIVQRYWFKFTRWRYGEGRRVFKMAPLHHHFQMLGWREEKIVIRFWIIALIFAVASLISLKLR